MEIKIFEDLDFYLDILGLGEKRPSQVQIIKEVTIEMHVDRDDSL